MKKHILILLRHGKSLELIDFPGSDFERPLTSEWKHEAELMGQYFARLPLDIKTVLSSPSIRTRETAELCITRLKHTSVDFEDALYTRGKVFSDALAASLALVQNTENQGPIVMVWHNPTLTDFAEKLTGDTVPTMKKWAILILEWKASRWSDISWWDMSVSAYITPSFLHFVE